MSMSLATQMLGSSSSSRVLGGGSAVHSSGLQCIRRSSRGRAQAVKANALLDFFKPKKKAVAKPKRETVVLEPAYNLQAGLAVLAGLEGWQVTQGATLLLPVAAFTGLLAVFLTLQAQRISFVFDDEAFEIKKKGEETDNVLVGGRNRWTYDSFVNWEMWWPAFPILVYYKETQTKPEGQVHFFPIIFNGQQLYKVMVERCGPSVGSGPKGGGDGEEEEEEEE